MVFTTIQLTPLKECAAATSIDKVSAVKSKPDAHHRLHGCREPSIKNGRKKKSRTIPSLDGFFFLFFFMGLFVLWPPGLFRDRALFGKDSSY